MLISTITAVLALVLPPADTLKPVDSAAVIDSIKREFESNLTWQTGRVELGGGIATLDVPAGYRFLGKKDAQRVLTKVWGNPPNDATLGLLFPPDAGPFTGDSWAVSISFVGDGYVKDDEAATLDYATLLKDMQQQLHESNPERAKAGYSTAELLGWAEPPSYDKQSHKLYWAKRLQFSSDSGQTLNYGIRVLGRKGVLVLNAIAGISLLDSVKVGMPTVLAAAEFTPGNRYTDFDANHGDKVAAYGIAALIAGGVLAKAGAFKMLIPLLIAAKKFIVIGVLGFMAWLRRFLGRKKEAEVSPPATTP